MTTQKQSISQARLVLIAMVVAESAWLSALYSVIGVALNLPTGSLDWLIVIGLMVMSLMIIHLSPSSNIWIERSYRFRTSIALILIYLATSLQMEDGMAIKPLWILEIFKDTGSGEFIWPAFMNFILGVIAWWRGGKLASTEILDEGLKFTMRIGAAALAFVALVDISQTDDLNTATHIFVFFAAGLGGLGIHRIFAGNSRSARRWGWQSILLGPVSLVLGLGLIFSLLSRGLLDSISGPALSMLHKIASSLLWALILPIGTLLNLVIAGFMKFFSRPYDPEPIPQSEISVEQVRQGIERAASEEASLAEEGVQTSYSILLQIIEWIGISILLVIIVLLAIFLFSRAYKRMLTPRGDVKGENRESIRENADVFADLGDLLLQLVKNRTFTKEPAHNFKLPKGPPGIVDAIKLYYEMLDAAEKNGIGRKPSQTSNEYRNALSQMFPYELVMAATDAFNKAFYGHQESTEELIMSIRSSLPDQPKLLGNE